VTSLADKLHLDFAIIHRETHHDRKHQPQDDTAKETKLTLVGGFTQSLTLLTLTIRRQG
jgi:hypothetical protein